MSDDQKPCPNCGNAGTRRADICEPCFNATMKKEHRRIQNETIYACIVTCAKLVELEPTAPASRALEALHALLAARMTDPAELSEPESLLVAAVKGDVERVQEPRIDRRFMSHPATMICPLCPSRSEGLVPDDEVSDPGPAKPVHDPLMEQAYATDRAELERLRTVLERQRRERLTADGRIASQRLALAGKDREIQELRASLAAQLKVTVANVNSAAAAERQREETPRLPTEKQIKAWLEGVAAKGSARVATGAMAVLDAIDWTPDVKRLVDEKDEEAR